MIVNKKISGVGGFRGSRVPRLVGHFPRQFSAAVVASCDDLNALDGFRYRRCLGLNLGTHCGPKCPVELVTGLASNDFSGA
jgi:hypothetical protein